MLGFECTPHFLACVADVSLLKAWWMPVLLARLWSGLVESSSSAMPRDALLSWSDIHPGFLPTAISQGPVFAASIVAHSTPTTNGNDSSRWNNLRPRTRGPWTQPKRF